MQESSPSESPPAGPPWIRPDMQQQIDWRDDDIVISVPAKSGTTWTMNIVHQLLTGGRADFDDIYAEVPWLEFVGDPQQTPQQIVERINAMPRHQRRAFKTHSAPPAVPYFAEGTDKKVKYIVVFRNPEEALVSFRPFIARHTEQWFDLWQVPRVALCRDDFPSFYNEVIDAKGMQGMFFGFMAAWWPLRHAPNVLFLHFADMKHDHQGVLRRIAEFLDVQPDPQQWANIVEYTSFEWMKQHEDKFEASTVATVPILQRGAMIRKGLAGQAKSDGMTDEIAAHFRAIGEQIVGDPVALDWYYAGGELP